MTEAEARLAVQERYSRRLHVPPLPAAILWGMCSYAGLGFLIAAQVAWIEPWAHAVVSLLIGGAVYWRHHLLNRRMEADLRALLRSSPH